MKVKKYLALFIIPFIGFFYISNLSHQEVKKRTVIVNTQTEIFVPEVHHISFERLSTHINDSIYRIKNLYYRNIFIRNDGKEVVFKDILPPFEFKKNKDNDTIFIRKETHKYYWVFK